MPLVKEIYSSALKEAIAAGVEKSSVDILFEELNNFQNNVDIELKANEEMLHYDRFLKMFPRLLKGEPIQYILNKAYFYGLEFYVDNRVLIPRMETEELVELAIHVAENINEPIVYDVCCGSGCIGLTMKSRVPNIQLFLADISKEALAVSKLNALKLNINVTLIESDLLNDFVGCKKANIIVCNPPYISIGEPIDDLVWNNEPHIALIPPTGNGLEMYERMFKALPQHLQDMGYAFFEIGENQKEGITQLLKKYLPGSSYCVHMDIAGKNRILEVRYSRI